MHKQALKDAASIETFPRLASNNTLDGILLGNYGVARACTALANSASGFRTNNLASIFDCNSCDSTSAGFAVTDGVVVTGCTATSNLGPGIEAFSSCRLENNTCHLNGLGTTQHAGIRIRATRTVAINNTTSGNVWGIKVESTLCLIKGNTSTSNSLANFEIVAGNRVASIVNLATSGAVSGNSGGTPVADADANFVY